MTESELVESDLFGAAVSYSLRRGKLKAKTEADPGKSRSTDVTFVLAATDGRVIDRIPLDKLYQDAKKMQDVHLPDIGKSLPAIGKTAASLIRVSLFLGLLAVSLSVTVFFPPLGLFMLFILALVALTAK
jgi:hypothetical protein